MARKSAGPRRSEAKQRPQVVKALQKAQRQLALQARRLRHEHGLTQEAAAERIGISAIQLGRLERGDANVTLGTLVACAVAYRTELYGLFARSEERA